MLAQGLPQGKLVLAIDLLKPVLNCYKFSCLESTIIVTALSGGRVVVYAARVSRIFCDFEEHTGV
jgi:hypothetical protein